MNNEQKRNFWSIRYRVLPIAISFWAGIGVMSIFNIYKTVYHQNVISYDWIMLAVSIILISIGLIMYLILKKKYR